MKHVLAFTLESLRVHLFIYFTFLSTESVDHVDEGIKSKDIVTQTILGGSTPAMLMCTHFPQKYFRQT